MHRQVKAILAVIFATSFAASASHAEKGDLREYRFPKDLGWQHLRGQQGEKPTSLKEPAEPGKAPEFRVIEIDVSPERIAATLAVSHQGNEPLELIVLPCGGDPFPYGGSSPFSLRIDNSDQGTREAISYVGTLYPPAPPPLASIILPPNSRTLFVSTITLASYRYSGTPKISLTWSFCGRNGASADGKLSVKLPERSAKPVEAGQNAGDDRYASLFGSFAEALKDGKLERAQEIVSKHPRSERREALEAVVRIYRGDLAAGEGILDRLAAASDDERLFDQVSTLYELRDYAQGLYSSSINEARFKKKGMEYLEAAVRMRLKKAPYQQKITLLPPLKGRWTVASGPMPHRAYHSKFPEFFSYDIRYPGRPEDSFGKPIYAVADGVVTSLADGNDDNPFEVKLNQESRPNVMVIEHDGGIRSHYVHLKKGSARVEKGQRVRAGQQIAEIGNSGYTGRPHLHFHMTRRGSNFALPVRFSGLYCYDQETGRFEPTDDPSLAGEIYSESRNLPTSNGRSYSYDGGRFMREDGIEWKDFDDRGRVKFHLVEKRRAGGYLYLYDQGRRLMLRFPEAGGVSEYSKDQERHWLPFKPVIQD